MSDSSTPTTADPLRSVYTNNLPAILDQLGISLAISTYQAGRVILIRNDNGQLNTHFRNFHKPMGIARHQNELSVGGANTVWYYRNVAAVAPKAEPKGSMMPATCPAASMSPAT
jgi:hypothetical protein